MNRRTFCSLSAAGLACVPTVAFGQQTRLRVATLAIDNGAEPFYAIDQGLFSKSGLDVDLTVMRSGPAILAAIAGGAVDVGYSNAFSFVIAYAKSVPLTIVAPAALGLTTSPAQVLAVAKDAPFHRAADLNGKTIGVDALKGMTQITVQAWMDKNGGNSASVQWVEVPSSAIESALVQHRIDAGSGSAVDFSFNGRDAGERILGIPQDAIARRYLAGAFVAATPWAAAHPDVVRRFTDAIINAGKWGNAWPNQSVRILGKYANLEPERQSALRKYRSPYAESITPNALQPVVDVALKYHLIERAFPPSQAFFWPTAS
jgi:NitT/TauT family transport system substrate-binding protein